MVLGRRTLMAGGLGVAGAMAIGAHGGVTARADETGWQADPDVIARAQAERPGFLFEESGVPDYQLPDPLIDIDGDRITTPRAWKRQRARLLEQFRRHVYGRRPEAIERVHREFEVIENDPAAMDGMATLRRVVITTRHRRRWHRFEVIVFVPNAASAPVPAFLLLNNRDPENTDPTREHRSPFWPAEEIIGAGYAIAALQINDLAPDDADTFGDGIIGLFEDDPAVDSRPADAWATLSAWGFGGSLALDYFERDQAIDAGRVAVVGHSRGGKAALWAAVEDRRFAMAISNDSGCGGAALSRRRFGETVAEINRVFPHWFCRNFRTYNDAEDSLPVDQHELIALLAPRPVCIASADEDLWSDPRGEFLSLAHASPVYALWGGEDIAPDSMPALNSPRVAVPRQYHIRSGIHDLTIPDWQAYRAAADRLWR